MIQSLKLNWPTYVMEAICLGLFMVSASLFGTLFYFPSSGLYVGDMLMRDILMGITMGVSAIVIIYSPMGKLSGAHMNPALTITFWGLGKIRGWDTLYYIVFQCIGGVVAVYGMHMVLGKAFEDSHVNFVITAPGRFGVWGAFITEIVIAFIMMIMVLLTSNHEKTAKWTGVFAGLLVMTYVIISGPISGFGMNPARSLASAVPSGMYPSFWIYVTAPFTGMFLAGGLYSKCWGKPICAKHYHSHLFLCIFNCGYCSHENTTSENNKLLTIHYDDDKF